MSLAHLPLRQALALLANGYLDEALAAVQRLDDPADQEALHDARVAMRRLDSLMRSYDAEFADRVRRKRRRAVRRLARASNPARDAEVQQAWLLQQAPGLTPRQQEGYLWLLARMQSAAQLAAEEALQQGVRRLARKLRPHFTALADDDSRTPYIRACAERAAPLAEEVLAALAAIDGPDDMGTAHQARILVKRLRYLLTPLRNDGVACGQAVTVLHRLQDQLGDLHDRYLLGQLLRDSAAAAAAAHARDLFDTAPTRATAWQPPPVPGLLALAARNQTELLACHAVLHQRYLDDLEQTVRAPLAAALAELRGQPQGAHAGQP